MRVYTSRQLNKRYAIFHALENKIDGIGDSNLIGILDNVKKDQSIIENYLLDMKDKLKECGLKVVEVLTNKTDYWCLYATNENYINKEFHHFEIKSYDDGNLYVCDGVGLL